MTTNRALLLSRRRLLAASGAALAFAHLPRVASAAGARDPRIVVIVLRGALDGLAVAPPVGDPDYAAARGALALAPAGKDSGKDAIGLIDGFFGLHSSMPVFARLFEERRASVVHAVATSFRERSHFDGQDVLESGYAGPGHSASGWLNRAVAACPANAASARLRGLAVGAVAPLVMRGPAPTMGWTPQTLPSVDEDLAERVLALYAHADPTLAAALGAGLDADRIAMRGDDRETQPRGKDRVAGMRRAAAGAARLLAADDGPRAAALAFDGWDTHINEAKELTSRLAGLDGALEELESGLGAGWSDTVVVAITEFGRTVKVNGAGGADHGTASVALLAGGAVKGGRVIADWPGLKPRQLYQARDLAPTCDLRAVLKGVLAQQLGLSAKALATDIFPDSAAVAPMRDLLVV
jgi:uncharacterized protein (DUF1501 family)